MYHELVKNAEPAKYSSGIWSGLDALTDFCELRRALKDGSGVIVLRQGQAGRESGNARFDDDFIEVPDGLTT